MRGITFNKQNLRGICIFCKKNTVPLGHHMERCEECKKKKTAPISASFTISEKEPIAVVEHIESQSKMFVDDKGNILNNHGYDLENDPRGWQRNKRVRTRTLI